MTRSSVQRSAFRVLAGIFALGAFGGLLGFELFVGWFDTSDGGIHRVHLLGFGILFGVLLTTAAVALARRPEGQASAFLQVVAVAVATLVAAAVSADGGYLMLGLIVAVAAAILLAVHPSRADVVRLVVDPSPLLGTIAAVGAIPLVWFGLTVARLQRDGNPADPHVSGDHWANMAAMAFGLVLVGLLAAMRVRGWRVTAWCAGMAVAVYGLASIVFARFPGTQVPYPGSEGVGWGMLALIGGLAFVAGAEWEARRSPAPPSRRAAMEGAPRG